MLSKNKISATLPQADKDEILTKFAEIKNKLPFLMNLTKGERSDLRKVGSKNMTYVIDCLRAGQTFPEILPQGLSMAELERDLQLHHSMNDLAVSLRALLEGIEDTAMAAGSDAMITSDQVYAYLKQGAKEDTNIKAQLDLISGHFKKPRKRIE